MRFSSLFGQPYEEFPKEEMRPIVDPRATDDCTNVVPKRAPSHARA